MFNYSLSMMDLSFNIRVSRITFTFYCCIILIYASHKQVNINMVWEVHSKAERSLRNLRLPSPCHLQSLSCITGPSGLDSTHLWLGNSWQASGLVTHLPCTKSWGDGEAETADGSAGAPCSLAGEEKMGSISIHGRIVFVWIHVRFLGASMWLSYD